MGRAPSGGRDMNHFMARLIFCFFAVGYRTSFTVRGLFTRTVEQISARDSSTRTM